MPDRSLFEREPEPLPPELVAYLEGKDGAKRSRKRKDIPARSGGAAAKTPAGPAKDLEWHEQLKYDEDIAIRIMRHCGADVTAVGEAFLCLLPGHDERNPSAALWRNDSGEIIFRDWHERDGKEWYLLANVYALWSSKKRGMHFYDDDEEWVDNWWARALYESGYVDRPLPTLAIKQVLPENTPKHAQFVYKAVCELSQFQEWFYGKSTRVAVPPTARKR